MDGLDVGHLGGGDDARDVEVALGGDRPGRCRWPRRRVEVRRAAVGLGVDHRDLDAEVVAGPDHPQGDLAAVGDQDLLNMGVKS